MWSFESMYKDQIKWQKSFWPQHQFVMSKRRIPSVFFLKFIFSKLFIAIVTLKMYSFFISQFKWISNKKILNCLLLLRFKIIYKSKIFRIKKNRSFLRLLWAQIFLRQFIKFWHKCAILCAPTVLLYCAHGLIKYLGTKAKCRHLKILTCTGTLRQVFIRVYRLEMQSVGIFDPALWTVGPLTFSLV
jgi:hypothetical protein